MFPCLFGRRLPEVGRAIGKTVADFRRGMDDFKREVDKDGSLSDAKASIQDLKKAVEAPRIATDPRRMFKKLTDDALSTPSRPDEEQPPAEPPSDPGAEAK